MHLDKNITVRVSLTYNPYNYCILYIYKTIKTTFTNIQLLYHDKHLRAKVDKAFKPRVKIVLSINEMDLIHLRSFKKMF